MPGVMRDEGGLGDDGVLNVRGHADDLRRVFSRLDVDVALERRAAVEHWGRMSKCSSIRVLSIALYICSCGS